MRYLFIVLLLFLGCDGDPMSPETDCAGVSGGSAVINECDLCVGGTSDVVDLCDADEDGYDDRDIQVLQDIIDINSSLEGQNPLEIYEEGIWDDDGRLTSLTISGNQLTSLPESIGNLSSLSVLALYSNQLTSLPENIGNLSNLEELNLSGNQLISIPNSIINLTNLNVLVVSSNQIEIIPNTISNLTNLNQLSLVNNQIVTLPNSIINLTNLNHLGLGGNQLISLPNNICNIEGIISLYSNNLCNEYYFDCISSSEWSQHGRAPQDQSNCCEGPEGQPNWTTCPE